MSGRVALSDSCKSTGFIKIITLQSFWEDPDRKMDDPVKIPFKSQKKDTKKSYIRLEISFSCLSGRLLFFCFVFCFYFINT